MAIKSVATIGSHNAAT